LLATVQFIDKESGMHYILLSDPTRQVPINFTLVREGFAKVERRNEKDHDIQVLVRSTSLSPF
jgi:hypothetical protein